MGFEIKGRAQDTLDAIVKAFESGSIAPAIARTVIQQQKSSGGRPIDGWSFRNQIIARLIGDTDDARTFKQWLKVGRVVTKGSKATHLLAPVMGYATEKDEVTGEKTKRQYLRGLKSFPVFAYEQTELLDASKWRGEGEAFVAPDYTPDELPPLHAVAESWGVKVSWSPFTGGGYGWAAVSGQQIGMHTEDIGTWLHELGHIAETRTRPNGMIGGQHWDQETVAESTSAVLRSMLGLESDLGRSYEYIAGYAKTEGIETSQAVMKVFARIMAAVDAILSEAARLGEVDALEAQTALISKAA
tara:strand:- start:251 stop:1153 length:903 start_codon:yes stop_codon:yes gene_type:complete